MNNAEEILMSIEGMQKEIPIHLEAAVYNQFAVEGSWLRANLHCHLAKKEKWPVAALEHYEKLGYSVIAGMDHDRIIDMPPNKHFVVIPGAELSCAQGHLLAFGIDSVPGEKGSSIPAMISEIKQTGGISVLAHPFKTGYGWKELTGFCEAGLDGLEVVNSNMRGKGADTGRSDQLWHNLLREGYHLIAFGGDDAHGVHEDITEKEWGGIPHVAWTGILSKTFTSDGVLDAIRHGRTYASEGPEIRHISFHGDGRMIVRCSPCVACHFRSAGGTWGGSSCYPSAGSSHAEEFIFDFGAQGYRIADFMVVILLDKHGRRAWTSPIRMRVKISKRELQSVS